VRTIRRGGPYLRVADPEWEDPLDGRHAGVRGGRWNPPESFPVVYLTSSEAVARAYVFLRLEGQPFGPEDLRRGPVLVRTRVPEDRYVNAVTEAGLRDLGLPETYPLDGRRRLVRWSRCQPIGLEARERGLPGVAARSARGDGEELAYFGTRRLRRGAVRQFTDWFWTDGPLR
jgi:hypothetical protein